MYQSRHGLQTGMRARPARGSTTSAIIDVDEDTTWGLGAQRIVELGAALPAGHPQRWDAPEQVPDEPAMTALPSFEQTMLIGSEHRILTFYALPWVTGATVDELYVPARYMEAYGSKFDADRTRDMLDRHARYHWIGQPERAEKRPGRNEPCSCGSGKKYKRCCGASA